MGAECSSVQKSNAGDEKKASIASRWEAPLRCCSVESGVGPLSPVSPNDKPILASAIKGRKSLRNSNSTDSPFSSESSSRPFKKGPYSSFRPSRIDQARVLRNFQTVRRVALEAVGELNHFNVFVSRNFESPTDAFEWLAGSAEARTIDSVDFIKQLERRPFTGQCDRVFYALCEEGRSCKGHYLDGGAQLVLRRERFLQRLRGMGTPFLTVVRLLVATRSFGIPLKEVSDNGERKHEPHDDMADKRLDQEETDDMASMDTRDSLSHPADAQHLQIIDNARTLH